MSVVRLSSVRVRLRNERLALAGSAATPTNPGTPDGVITLSEPADMQGYQRVGTSKAVPISLSYTGNATQIEVRAVPVGTTITDTGYAWVSLPTNVEAKTASGAPVVQQGGWYVWQARSVNNTATNVTGTNRFGVGMFIAPIGQSNMENAPKTAWYYPLGDKRATFYNRAGTFNRIGRINDNRPVNQNAGTYGSDFTEAAKDGGSSWNGDFVVFLANQVVAGLGIPVFLIERAVGGSAIATWQAGQENWNTFASAVAAAGGDIEMAIWYQGETNAAGMDPVTHRAALANVHAQCQELGGRNTSNFHFGVISLGPGSYGGSVEGEFGAMRALIAEYGRTTPGAFLAASAHDGVTTDGVHLYRAAYSRLGDRAGKSALARFGVGTTGSGPYATGATLSGAVITLAVQHTGGTALRDGAGGTGQALTGFRVFLTSDTAKTSPLAITSSAVASAMTIEITLAAAPTGPVVLDYAMMNTPHGTSSTVDPNLSSIPCDNISTLYGTTSAPLQPFAAITVTGG